MATETTVITAEQPEDAPSPMSPPSPPEQINLVLAAEARAAEAEQAAQAARRRLKAANETIAALSNNLTRAEAAHAVAVGQALGEGTPPPSTPAALNKTRDALEAAVRAVTVIEAEAQRCDDVARRESALAVIYRSRAQSRQMAQVGAFAATLVRLGHYLGAVYAGLSPANLTWLAGRMTALAVPRPGTPERDVIQARSNAMLAAAKAVGIDDRLDVILLRDPTTGPLAWATNEAWVGDLVQRLKALVPEVLAVASPSHDPTDDDPTLPHVLRAVLDHHLPDLV